MIAKNQWAIRIAFFSGLGMYVIIQALAWLFWRKKATLKLRLLLVLTQTASFLLIGNLFIRWHIDTLWVRFLWWWEVAKLKFHYWTIVDNLQWEVTWKSFWAYWDGFQSGAGLGFLLGIALVAILKTRKTA
jgi:hypothetical protein